MKEPIIVGYDPGTTAALAIIDTKGNILFLKSKRSFKKGEIIDIITDVGRPLLIAGDRRPLPKSVEKLSRALGCKPFYPRNSLTISEKELIVRKHKKEIKDNHEKAALASALYAFGHYSGVFKRTREILESQGLNNFYDRVVESVITGEVENITEAINRIQSGRERMRILKNNQKFLTEKKTLDTTVSKMQERTKLLEKDIQILKESNEKLREKLRRREEEIVRCRKKLVEKIDLNYLETTKKDIDRLKDGIKEFSVLTEKLKLLRRIELKGYYPVIEVEEIRDSTVKDIDKNLDLEDRVILAESIENAQILNDYKIKALIFSENPTSNVLEKVDFPVITKKDISMEKVKNISAVRKQDLEECIKKARKAGFIQFLEGHRKRRL